jgi:O-antigen ligase
MKAVSSIHKYLLFIFFFSVNFEMMNLFNLGINYLSTKISISLLLGASLMNFPRYFSFKNLFKILLPLYVYFLVFTLINFLNINSVDKTFFDFPFFLNCLLLIVLSNSARVHQDILLKGLLVFVFSTFVLSMLFFLNISVSTHYEGRYTIFGINENFLGITFCISFFISLSVIFENRLKMGKARYLLILLLPIFFGLMIKTGSRVAFISFLMCSLYYLYNINAISRGKKFILSSALVFFSLIFFLLFLRNSTVGDRLNDSIEQGDLSSRDLIWLNIFDIVSNNFFFGVGKTGYNAEITEVFGEVTSPHNVFIESFCYTGLFGFMIFFFFLINVFRRGLFRNGHNPQILPGLLLIPLFGILLSGQLFEVKLGWLLIAYVVGSTREDVLDKKFQPSRIA